MLYRYRKGGGGGVIAREIVASRVQAPPAFCTEAKVAKGGAYLRDTTVYVITVFTTLLHGMYVSGVGACMLLRQLYIASFL